VAENEGQFWAAVGKRIETVREKKHETCKRATSIEGERKKKGSRRGGAGGAKKKKKTEEGGRERKNSYRQCHKKTGRMNEKGPQVRRGKK